MPAHHIIQGIRLRQARGIDIELGGELFGQPIVEQARAGVSVDLE